MASEKNVTAKKLALVGYGKMGRLVEQLAPEHGFEVVLRLDEADNRESAGITTTALAGVDVAVEFSRPEAAPENLKRLAHAK
jgi:4-hydroxy-tetrahydrodipicolinate reductase